MSKEDPISKMKEAFRHKSLWNATCFYAGKIRRNLFYGKQKVAIMQKAGILL